MPPAEEIPSVRRIACRVAELADATHDIRVVRLDIQDGQPFPFRAGQYANVAFGDLPPRDYSMANVPGEPLLEFHVRQAGGDGASAYVAERLRIGERVAVEGPFGGAWLRLDHPGPMLAVAGGSGLAPIKSIVETALSMGFGRDIHLFFGARDERDVYLEDRFRALARAHPNLRFQVVLSHPRAPTSRPTGFVSDAVAALADVRGCKAYLAGPPVMVEATYDVLRARGLGPEDIHADPFYSEAEKAAGLARL